MSPSYRFRYYCAKGSHWVPREEVLIQENGLLVCPVHRLRVRTKPLSNREGEG
jgi:hypothetical protein